MGSTELLIVLFLIGLLVFAIWKGRKNPKLVAFILLGLGLIVLIVSFKLKDIVSSRTSQEDLQTGNTMLLILSLAFLIPGAIYLYKSLSKNE